MVSSLQRKDLYERLRYTFITTSYREIDELLAVLVKKSHFEELCEGFFQDCHVNEAGYLIPGGFFSDQAHSASLRYALYELLGRAPDTFLLKHRVTRVQFLRKKLSGCFRLSRGLFSLPRLTLLRIRGMGISYLPEELALASSLKSLDLGRNNFRAFPEILLKLSRLSYLNLEHNFLSKLPENLYRFKHLRVLNLQGNTINTISFDFQRLPKLHTLNLSMNALFTLPKSLLASHSLQDLRVAYNNLPAVEEASWESKFPLETAGAQGFLELGP